MMFIVSAYPLSLSPNPRRAEVSKRHPAGRGSRMITLLLLVIIVLLLVGGVGYGRRSRL
jgi:hypothetical protein